MAREDVFSGIEELMLIYRSLELEIIKVIISRLELGDSIEDVMKWQTESLSQTRYLTRDVEALATVYLSTFNKKFDEALNKTYDTAIKDVDSRLVPHLGDRTNYVQLSQILKAYRDQIFTPNVGDLPNFINQTLIGTQYGDGIITRVYTDIVNRTTAQAITGQLTFHQALQKTILEWVDNGIMSTFVDKGGHIWSLERYTNTVLRSTISNTYNQVHLARMREFDVYTVLMSSIMDSAPRCVDCQGQVLDMRPPDQATSGYPSIYLYGYGNASGTLGINCRHSVWVFVPGVHENNQPQFDREEDIAKSKVRAQQRELERRIRTTKKEIIVLDQLKNQDQLKKANIKLARQQEQIRELLKDATWLRRNDKNEKVYTPRHLIMDEYRQYGKLTG